VLPGNKLKESNKQLATSFSGKKNIIATLSMIHLTFVAKMA
jgi:hypothetical protein